MSEEKIIVKNDWEKNAHLNKDKYEKMYNESIQDPETFWSRQALSIDWFIRYNNINFIRL